MPDWVTAAEGAEIAGVSRQYLHNEVDRFSTAHRLSPTPDKDGKPGRAGFLVFQRSEMEQFALSRATRQQERAIKHERVQAETVSA